ncbi:MAG: C-terminal helicase domain-containing protein, partial [Bacteroidales bacterium]|nr:C-terminal helicase domain-containing protein [Bacteroidales bacterium]
RVSFLPVEKEMQSSTSDKTNLQEAQLIAALVEATYRLYKENQLDFNSQKSIGVIVPYRHQISTIRQCLQRYNNESLMEIAIDTVERFQGSQRDVIVYGFTVSKPYQLDFLTNNVYEDETGQMIDRKLNVALTRARELLVIVGSKKIMERNELFSQLLKYEVRL